MIAGRSKKRRPANLKQGRRSKTRIALAPGALLEDVLQTIRRVALISSDPSGTITFFSRGAEILTGYTAEEVVGRQTPLLFHLPEEVAARTPPARSAAVSPQARYEVFTRDATPDGIDESKCTYRRKDGTTIAIYLAIQSLRGTRNQGFLSTVRPVHDQSIDGTVATLRAFGESSLDERGDGVLELSRAWTVLYRNERSLEVLPNLTLAGSIWDLYPALRGTHVEEQLRIAMEQRRRTNYENYYPPLDLWFRVHAVPCAAGIRIIFQNITAEQKLKAQLEKERILREKRVEALSHMAGGLAHEISNPLAIINMMAGDLESFATGQETVDAEEVKTTSAIILETSNRAMAILRGLKGFTREASKDPMASANILEILDECLLLQRSRFERNTIELRTDTAHSLPPLVCREVQIGQILNNLLNNAFDAIAATITSRRATGGWACIRMTSDGNTLQVDVSDSGPGVPEDAKPHLMEPFFTTKEIGGGTGIGLSLSRAIAEDHGGIHHRLHLEL